ncbi:MAG: pyridoxal-phosphate dependent enzyme [Bacteroidales bacterium]|nr:pyridoxal-phosphate dependent enzyme [Bacteroidales bacterium]
MKYQIVCKKCGKVIGDFKTWFAQDQKCSCGSTYAEVDYENKALPDFSKMPKVHEDYQHLYFDYLPIENPENIVTCNEGLVPIERWEKLEEEAKRYGINCEVYVCRNDRNGGSGTFKDISAALAASVLKENGIKKYCLASTGNAGVSFATYLAKAGISFHEFAPSFIDEGSIKAIKNVGQDITVSASGYGAAKAEAADYHKANQVLISGGNTDPLRIESKRTLVFECLRQIGKMPTVYMQAVAGGTSPLAFEKGFNDLQKAGRTDLKLPRMLLVQQDECDPMVTAWEKAKAHDFPQGWEHDYEAKKDLKTNIGILTAANPGNYPLVAPLVRKSGGDFLRVKESELPEFGKEMMQQKGILLGPASMVCYAGFFKALGEGLIHNGDCVLLNTGESCERAAWFKKEVLSL